MDRQRRILIVSYLFPPNGGIAVQRALSFAKYLPPLGWDVHVLKGRNASGPVQDPGLCRHIPSQVRLHSAFTPEIPFEFRHRVWKILSRSRNGKRTAKALCAFKEGSSPAPVSTPAGGPSLVARFARRILCPEPEILWTPFAFRKACGIIQREKIDTVLVTVPPFSILTVGTALKKRFPNIRLISDFRDEWLGFYLKDFEYQNSDYTRRRAEAIERESVEASDLVLAVTETSRETIRARYPKQPDRKFACLPNGYDPEVFEGFLPRPHEGSNIVVTHVGTVYKTASPKYYLDSLDALPEAIRGRFETRFVGRIAEDQRAVLEDRKSCIKIMGFMRQEQALRQIEETDFLLLTMTNEISLPGKLFEYLATGKRILALAAPDSEVARILAETRAGWCADPFDPEAVQAMLMRAFQERDQPASGPDWDQPASGPDWDRPVSGPDWEKIRRYERPQLAAELSELIEELSGERLPLAPSPVS
jgi:glycosyltransferase involved in cell wall biosynthesis